MTSVGRGTNEEAAADFSKRSPTGWHSAHIYVLRCVQTIENALLEADWALYRDADRTQRIPSSPALEALNNPGKTAGGDFKRAIVQWLLLHGNCYIFNAGTVQRPSLFILPGDRDKMSVIPGEDGFPSWYRLRAGNSTIRYELDEITHLKLFSLKSSLYGMGVIEALKEDLLIGALSKRTRRNFWTNDATPGGILTSDKDVSDEEATRQVKRWVKLFRGPDRAGKTAYLGGGTKYQSVSVAPKDMQWLQQAQIEAKDVSVAFGVPLVLLDGSAANFATAREATKTLWTLTVLPLGASITSGLSRSPWCPGMLDLDTARVEALQADTQAARTSAREMLLAGEISLNRARELSGEPPLGAAGDVFYVPVGVVVTPLSQLGDDPDATETDGDQDAADDAGDATEADDAGDDRVDAPVGAGDPPGEAPAHADARELRGVLAQPLPGAAGGVAGGGAQPVKAGPLWDGLTDVPIVASPIALPVVTERRVGAYGSDEHKAAWERKAATGKSAADRLKRQLKKDFQAQLDALLQAVRGDDDDKHAAPGTHRVKAQVDTDVLPPHDPELFATLLQAIAEAAADGLLDDLALDDDEVEAAALAGVAAFGLSRAKFLVDALLETTKQAVLDLVARFAAASKHELQDALTATFRGFIEHRSQTITTSEHTSALTAGQQATADAARDAGYTLTKTWITELDDRVRDTHAEAHGQEVGVDEDFEVGAARGPGPGLLDDEGENINCRCAAEYSKDQSE